MELAKTELLAVKLDGKNDFLWEFQFRNFVQGKELWGFIDRTTAKPSSDKADELAKWTTKNARVISWILNSVEPSIALNLHLYHTASEMWQYLRRLYTQENMARQFQLEYELAEYNQGDKQIQDYYSGFMSLWIEYDSLVYAAVPEASLAVVKKIHQTTQLNQFLMKLRREYEPIRVGLLNWTPLPTLDICLQELLREEQRCKHRYCWISNNPLLLQTPIS